MKYFTYEIADTGVELRLRERTKKFFSASEKTLSVSDWGDASSLAITMAVGLLHSIADEHSEKCHQLSTRDGYFLSYELIASFSELEAKALNLPSTLPYQLIIEERNAIGTPDYTVNWSLYKRNRPLQFKRKGCLLIGYEEIYRLPSAFLNIIELIDQYNESGNSAFDPKIAFLVELKSLLPEDVNNQISVEGEISKIELRHAAAFSLKIAGSKDSMSFDPVLFGRVTKEHATSGDDPIEEDEQLLRPNEAQNFAALFKRSPSVKATYLLGPGNYVFVDKSLRPALEVVKRAAKLSPEERIEFAKAPQKFIKEALAEKIEGNTDIEHELRAQEIDALFIETRQYSDRVKGMGVWVAPDLPWLKREPSEWRADNYSFFVQGKWVSIPVSDLEKSVEELRAAIVANRGNVTIGGKDLKPDRGFLEVLEGFVPKKPDPNLPDSYTEKQEKDAKSSPSGPIVPLAKENFEAVEYNKSLIPKLEKIKPTLPKCLPSGTKLKKHQKSGVEWLVDAYNRGYPGVLMADDMGLGKTLQALTFLAILVESGKTYNVESGKLGEGEPVLVVAPVGLLANWEEEHHKHLSNPGLGTFAKLYGNGLKGFKLLKGKDIDSGFETLDTDKLKQCDWLLTTYETLRDYQASFAKIKFSCVVFDELQKAKNPRGLISHSTKVLNRDFAIGLTGTPVENLLADLWTIMDILSPGRLKDLKTFVQTYPEPDPDNPMSGLQKLRSLSKELLEPAVNGPAPILRRLKSELQDTTLPEKILTPSKQTTMLMPDKQNLAYTDISNELNSGQIVMLRALSAFKAVSLHPLNPFQVQAEDYTIEKNDEYIKSSARLTVTFQLLDQIHSRGEKVLIFLESLGMQPVLASLIKQKYNLPQQPMIINGLVSGEARQKRVNEFQSQGAGFDVMIISPKAGGVGLTLTVANNVIHLDRWWNPAVEDQCTDRVYRIGQTKPVRVFVPISRNAAFGERSFDCVLDRLLESKRALAKGLFIPTTIAADEFGRAFMDGIEPTELPLEEIDCLERGKDFETYVQQQLKKAGLKVSITQSSYDYGADLIVEHKDSGTTGIIQCKHRSSGEKTVSENAASEVVKAKSNYNYLGKPELFIVTNAGSITKDCEKRCLNEGITVIMRSKLLNLGPVIKEKLAN